MMMRARNRCKFIGMISIGLIILCLAFTSCTKDVGDDNSGDAENTSALYQTVEQYLSAEFKKEYTPYYEILNLEIKDWHEESENSATFFYTMTHKNYDRDPDTVQYIIDARENNSPEYAQLKKEYLEPKEGNYEFKAVVEDGKVLLYHNASPKGTDWQRVEVSDFILKPAE